ncbi:MAG: glycosyl transferase family 1 [Acidobacteria bacterium]|nr:MAG: glycosyl transferase family 1 [Acidobacteriota bacterium]
MRVSFLSVSAEMGGSEVSLLELLGGLGRLEPGWALDLIVPREGALAVRARDAGVAVRVLPLPERLARLGEDVGAGAAAIADRGASMLLAAGGVALYSRRLRKLLEELRPDVVHTNGFKVHVLGARAAPRGTPVVWHLHEYVGARPISRALLRRYVSRCAAIVANSRSVAADVTAAIEPAAPVTTIHNAVDPNVFTPDGPAVDLDRLSSLPLAPSGTVRVGLVATFGRWKGHDTFLQALRALPHDAPVRAYIIGDALYDTAGSQHTRADFEERIAALGLADRVGLTGFIDNAAGAMRALDVIVHASTQPEPFGLVIAEGMASGRAVIVSAAGGAGELVTDGVDALTHRPGDVRGLSRCIASLATDGALRRRLGAAARETARRRFDPTAFIRAFINVYQACRDRALGHLAGR